ncbi:MAG: methionyl-tRNA formyltransferase [Alphaproteobacteria bacterium]|nr:methionyl-tRNA formyltransferase [Alphaproteobacteria bacterium]
MRVIFMGTPEFAVRALARILDSPHEVIAVYTTPARPAGRGREPRQSPVHGCALDNHIPVYTPGGLKDSETQAEFAALGADIAVVAAYGLILPKPILDAPRLGGINIHASLLPRWRGAAPIQRAILAGDSKTGITIMQMDQGLDTGPILAAEEIDIGPATTCAELHDRLAVLGGRMVVYVLNGLATGVIKPAPQPDQGVLTAAKLTRAEGRMDWRRPAIALERQMRAFSPWPGAWFEIEGTRIKVIEARVMAEATGMEPGEVLDHRLTIACGGGSLRILTLQREGKTTQGAAEFLRGFNLSAGTLLPLPEGEGGDTDGGGGG